MLLLLGLKNSRYVWGLNICRSKIWLQKIPIVISSLTVIEKGFYITKDLKSRIQKSEFTSPTIKCPWTGWKCGIGEKDDNRYKECDPEKVPNPEIDFMKVKDVNSWYFWLLNTLKPNVRVQEWYNGEPPYGLRGYLDDKANR